MPLLIPFVHDSCRDQDVISHSPIVQMQLAEHSDGDGRVIVGPHLMTDGDIDELVDRLITDAETFRRTAKYALDLARSRSLPK